MSTPTIPKTMRAHSYTKNGLAADVLTLTDSYPVPTLSSSEVLVEVHASALNPVDYQFMEGGLVNYVTSKPFVPGFDIAGVVVSVGSKVKKFKLGDRVYAMNSFRKCGGLAEYATVNESLLAIIPSSLDFPEAAAVPLAALTAWQGLVEYGHIKEGQKVFVKGGSGGVGTYVVQIAKLFGAEVTASCSERNIELVRSLGADRVVDYNKEDPAKVFTNNDFDIVFDTVGGPELYQASRTFMKPKGYYVSIVGDATGGLSGWRNLFTHALPIFTRKAKAAVSLGVSYDNFTAWSNGKELAEIGDAIQQGKIRPIIDSKYAFEDAVAAFEKQQSGRARGKIVVLVKAT